MDHNSPLFTSDVDPVAAGGAPALPQHPEPLVNRCRSSSDLAIKAGPVTAVAGAFSGAQSTTTTTSSLGVGGSAAKRPRGLDAVPHAWAETPKKVVHIHDDGDSDGEGCESPDSNKSNNSSGLEEDK